MMRCDKGSFILGMIVAFSECVAGGCKRMALSPPLSRADFEAVRDDPRSYARAAMTEFAEHDPVRGRRLLQAHGDRTLVVNPPAMPLDGAGGVDG